MSRKTILCYGDSNTWGCIPCTDYSQPMTRYPFHQRWPGILQGLLGERYHIIQEGLNGRTTNLDHAIPPDRNGKNYLPPCLYSHAPIDLIILALGGNDTKTYFNRTPEQICEGLSELVEIVQTTAYGPDLRQSPKILIVPPVIPLDFTENYIDENGTQFLQGAVKKIEAVVDCYAQLANAKECHYLNLSADVKPSPVDGVHYDETAHQKFAEQMSKKVQEIFGVGK